MAPIVDDDYYLRKLLSKIQTERGFDFSSFRRTYVQRRVGTRLLATGSPGVRGYMRRLDSDPAEYARLLDALTVNVSEFFRDKTAYRYIADHVVPEIVDQKTRKDHQLVRVWSAGCSTGQEPYSMAMLFMDELAKRDTRTGLSVIATDIDRAVLATAKTARYPVSRLDQIPPNLRHRYVRVDGDEFELVPEIKYAVKFRMLDLFADNPISAVDLIMCRNVMIYFDRRKQLDVYRKFVKAIRKGGFLVIGKSEKVAPEVLQHVTVCNLHERVYQRPY